MANNTQEIRDRAKQRVEQQRLALLEDCVRRAMEHWPAYHESHSVMVRDIGGRLLFVGYNLQNEFHWHANIVETTFYLLKIKLPKTMRGIGLGDKLYKCIEQAAANCGCTEIRQTPSGWTITGETRESYLVRRGWIKDIHEVYKELRT